MISDESLESFIRTFYENNGLGSQVSFGDFKIQFLLNAGVLETLNDIEETGQNTLKKLGIVR